VPARKYPLQNPDEYGVLIFKSCVEDREPKELRFAEIWSKIPAIFSHRHTQIRGQILVTGKVEWLFRRHEHEYRDWRVTGRDLKSARTCVFACFTGPLFDIFGHFCPFSSISTIFRARFFLFSLFFHFQIRYTRTANPRLYYCPSETRVKAGALVTRRSRKTFVR
jgi:hypothetical protein